MTGRVEATSLSLSVKQAHTFLKWWEEFVGFFSSFLVARGTKNEGATPPEPKFGDCPHPEILHQQQDRPANSLKNNLVARVRV